MARTHRRKSKIGRPVRQVKESPADRKRRSLMEKGFMGNLNDPRWGFTTRHLGKVDACVFYHPFAAKLFLDLMIGDDKIKWVDKRTMRTTGGLRIDGQQLRAIYDYKLKKGESEYVLPDNYRKRVETVRSQTPLPDYEAIGPEVRRTRHSRKGMFKMDTIAEELGLTPRACRGVLRKKGVEKPAHGWAWQTCAEVDEVKRIITGKNTVTVNFKGVTDGEA